MHTLGASLTGIYIGYLFFLIYKMRAEGMTFMNYAVCSAVILIFLLILLDWEDRDRINEQENGDHEKGEKSRVSESFFATFRKIMHSSFPSIMFMVILGMIIFFVSNTHLINQGDFFSQNNRWRIIFAASLILISCIIKYRSSKEDTFGDEAFGLGITIFLD
jgi:uncharacterized membrane protein YeiB